MTTSNFIYLLKVEGTAKIPDYVQIRDENFTLLAYFRPERPEKALQKLGFEEKIPVIKDLIASLPFGKVHKLDL